MTEEQLRELARTLRAEVADVLHDPEERRRLAAELDRALALPAGEAKPVLTATLRVRRETREWVVRKTGVGAADEVRGTTGLAGGPTASLGVHVVCPNGDYDCYLDRPDEDPGRCPHDGAKLVRDYD